MRLIKSEFCNDDIIVWVGFAYDATLMLYKLVLYEARSGLFSASFSKEKLC